jgi:RNA polymerase-associated protein RTF1
MADLRTLFSSPSPVASLGSDAMLESNASSPEPASASPIDDGPAYPLEGIYLDSADRARIQSLPEIQREEILAERAAENTKRQQDIQLKKALAATQAAASKHQKRKAAAADLDDDAGQRKSSRAKVEKRNVLDDYKKAREARGVDRTSRLDPRRDRGRKRRSRSASSASDRDADGESEVEWAPEVSSRREEAPAELKDFERCRVGRSSFAKVCFYPNFEETMKGCFARVSIGVNRETGENMYRMTQIKGKMIC